MIRGTPPLSKNLKKANALLPRTLFFISRRGSHCDQSETCSFDERTASAWNGTINFHRYIYFIHDPEISSLRGYGVAVHDASAPILNTECLCTTFGSYMIFSSPAYHYGLGKVAYRVMGY